MSPRRPAVRLLVAAVAVALSAAGTLPACGRGSSVHTPGRARPTSYRIVYRVERPATAAGDVSFEEVTVRRPFASRVAEFANDPGPSANITNTPQSATVTAIDEVFSLRADGLHDLAGREAGPPGGDQALAVELSEAAKRKLLRTAGAQTRTVAGSRCHDYRVAEPPAGPLKRLVGNDHDLVCIDETGL